MATSQARKGKACSLNFLREPGFPEDMGLERRKLVGSVGEVVRRAGGMSGPLKV